MKKTLSVFLIFVSMMSFSYTTVFAQGYLELIEARNDVGGGVIFVFHYTGDFNANDFKGGLVILGDQNFPMDCNITDKAEGIVQCTSSRAMAGQNVRINLAGQILYAFVPVRSGGSGNGTVQICYNVYDYYEVQGGNEWAAFTTHCQDVPASYLDTIQEYNPDYQDTYDYVFLPNDPGGCSMLNSITEDAYYYDFSGC
ncbi:MAG: hypothetical protein U0X74_00240 [Anaerolineales bacterium]